MLLEQKNYDKTALLGKTVLLTGGGGGIGFEAARAFSYMGAKVVIAEIDTSRGEAAQTSINTEFGNNNVDFFQIDLADEAQIDKLYEYVMEKYAGLDVIVNNAAVVPMGAVDAVSIADWDLSYAVNLRAPVLLTQKFLPAMKTTGGVIVFNPSAPGAYMSGYEIFKTAQEELCAALETELEGTSVLTYAIAPGFVKTDTCIKAVETVAASMGITTDEFYLSVDGLTTDVETAGAGYAVSVVNAEQYHGKKTMSYQVLVDNGLIAGATEKASGTAQASGIQKADDYEKLSLLFSDVAAAFFEQYQNWQKKKLFERQFVLTHFKKQMGLSAESVKTRFEDLLEQVRNGQWSGLFSNKELFLKLQDFYRSTRKMLQSYEKNAEQLKSDTALLDSWITTLQGIIDMLL